MAINWHNKYISGYPKNIYGLRMFMMRHKTGKSNSIFYPIFSGIESVCAICECPLQLRCIVCVFAFLALIKKYFTTVAEMKNQPFPLRLPS